MKKFPCTKCGECCKHVHGVKKLDRGDGTCKFLTAENLCGIYENRPAVCNIEKTWANKGRPDKAKYFLYSAMVCNALQVDAGIGEEFRIIL